MTMGMTIRQLRRQAGITAKSLARYLDVCPATISFYERDLRQIPVARLRDLARFFQVPPGDIIEGRRTTTRPPRRKGEPDEAA